MGMKPTLDCELVVEGSRLHSRIPSHIIIQLQSVLLGTKPNLDCELVVECSRVQSGDFSNKLQATLKIMMQIELTVLALAKLSVLALNF